MDCEGAEFEILLNADNETLSKIDMIVGEIHDDIPYIMERYKIEDLSKHLNKNGFEFYINQGMFYARKI